MIQAVSRFRVRNGKEAEVRDALLNRPHLADQSSGFLGMEVFDASRPAELGEITADAAPLLARYLASTQAVHLIRAARDGTIQGCNPAMAALLKIPADQLVGQSLWPLLPDADAAALRHSIDDGGPGLSNQFLINVVDSREGPFTLQCLIDVRPDGFTLLAEAPKKEDKAFQEEMIRLNNEMAVLTRENARKSRALEKALADLTEAQARLVHQEKMASLGQLTAGIAHEINNPIAFVRNNQSTLQRDFENLLGLINVVGESLDELTGACPAVADQILRKAAEIDLSHLTVSVPRRLADNVDGLERVRRIVLDLRNFSRLDEGGFKPCDIAEDIRSVLKFLSLVLEEHGVTVETHFPPLPPLPCAPGPLNQAISNVILNALQASRPGQSIRVSTAHEDGSFIIRVEDKGSGIAPEHLDKVFDPFFTTKPVGSGTGLGLSIAHQVVQAQGGAIQITSEIHKGTAVQLRLPLRSDSELYVVGTPILENLP